MYTGTAGKKHTSKDCTVNAIANGSMVIDIEDRDAYIGKLSAKSGDDLHIVLYQGEVDGEWKPAKDGGNAEMIRIVDVHTIKENYIFHLTKNNRLPKNVKAILKNFM